MVDARAYYNEHDKFCAGWLRNLAAAGLILPGDVDDRDIRDVRPADLAGYTQCHFFAGIGLWSLALRWAGWPDDRQIWTGSCPCQPFSTAGRGAGFGDDRHLWPAWLWLIGECAPVALAGEQVSGPDGQTWLDAVSADLEARGYACGAVAVSSAGVGAPNIRQRLYWVADADGYRCGTPWRDGGALGRAAPERGRADVGVADAAGQRAEFAGPAEPRGEGTNDGIPRAHCNPCDGLGDATRERSPARPCEPDVRHVADQSQRPSDAAGLGDAGESRLSDAESPDVCRTRRRSEGRAASEPSRPCDPWRELEWIACLDGKLRPTESGLFPLAARRPGDVARLRAYGNAINPHVAAEVMAAWLERKG